MSEIPTRTQVVVIGGGPAGSLLSHLLHLQGIDSVIVELRSREHVLERVRAGVIEKGSAEVLREAGLADRMDVIGLRHEGVNLVGGGEMLRIDFAQMAGGYVVVYGQTELQRDLYAAVDQAGIELIDEVADVGAEGLESDSVSVSFDHRGRRRTIDCDFVIGCDGAHGVTREMIPLASRSTFEREYPFVWVGLLSETPPVREELIYVSHDSGFALCSMRNENLSRYYVQGDAGDSADDWPDDKFWNVLGKRLPPEVVADLVTGPSVEKLVTPLRSWVLEPMSYGRLSLAGDVAHVVPPTGAKGLNLAISDVTYLAEALADHYATGSWTGIHGYSERALARVWKSVRFSWWMTAMMHRFPGMSDAFDRRLQRTELDYLFASESAQRAMAENYVGLPL